MIVAYTALGLWFVVALLLFMVMRPSQAAAATLIGGAMFLPERVGFNLPVLPEIAKDQITVLACLLGVLVFAGPELRRARIGRGPELLIVVISLGAVVTVLTNRDTVVSGATVLPGARSTDFVANIIEYVLQWGLPFVFGRALFTRSRDLRAFFLTFVIAGLIYSLFILVELRLSPQFHRWVYGFHQHGFSQTIRASGYRPMVFMRHGLHVALFVYLSMMASMAMTRARLRLFGAPSAAFSVYLTTILVLCKSVGSLVYGLVTAPAVLLASPRVQTLFASLIAVGIFAYPVVRALDWIPVDRIRAVAEEVAGPDRARSLVGRMETETQVMSVANQRALFGWSSAGRTMTYHETRPHQSLTVYDGVWLVMYSKGGIVLVGSVFLLLLLPVFSAARRIRRVRSRLDRLLLATLSLMVCINVFDMLPNSTTEPYLTLMSGVLSGALPGILREQQQRRRRRSPGPELRLRPGSGLADGLLAGRSERRPLRG